MSRLLTATLRPGLRPLGVLLGRARRWPVESQLAARRNAMVACTALAARRAERDDVEDYLRERPKALLVVRTAVAHA